jgi:hypothetical protein
MPVLDPCAALAAVVTDSRHTRAVQEPWMHAGRVWTDGEPFLAVDVTLRDAGHGLSNGGEHP